MDWCSAAPELQRHALRVLSGLSSIAAKLAVVLAQPEVDSDELQNLGFRHVSPCVQFAATFGGPRSDESGVGAMDGILLLNLSEDFSAALDCVSILDQLGNPPPILMIQLFPYGEESNDLAYETRYTEMFLKMGVDEVMTLYGEQRLPSHRVKAALVTLDFLACKTSEVISEEEDRIKAKQSKTLKALSHWFLWDLPGQGVLECIPAMDQDHDEQYGQNSRLGNYDFKYVLRSGGFSAVFKAEHPEHGVCAVKVIDKSSIQTPCHLFSINHELTIMLSLSAHRNIVPAYESLRSKSSIMLVMEYSGDLNLHRFIVKKLRSTGDDTLPADVTESFCKQAASAVKHVHANRVCHRDINLTNFIVSNDAELIRLADFGDACTSFHRGQLLLRACGSVPFAAPEAMRPRSDRKTQPGGYCGFCADVWSLGVTFVKLGNGLYGMERLLGWMPEPPTDAEEQYRDLSAFPQTLQDAPEMCVEGLLTIVRHMTDLQPADRWSMDMVTGSQGFCTG
mmetsp:Transcript_99157/g.289356  ORF Transcript_99157/g.289356 Transcript_99157/m.289356 type:complete len:508 (+) Transcript_99157:101-1624(+)